MEYMQRRVDNKCTAFDTLTPFEFKPRKQLDEGKSKANIWRESPHFRAGCRRWKIYELTEVW